MKSEYLLEKCSECDYAAVCKSELNTHFMRKHRQNVELKKCEYEDCEYSTFQKRQQKVHYERVHLYWMFQPGQKKKTTSTPSIVLFNPSHDVSIQLYIFNNNNKSEADELDKLSTHRQSSDSSTSHSISYMILV